MLRLRIPPAPPQQPNKSEDNTYTHLFRGQLQKGYDVCGSRPHISIHNFVECINGAEEKLEAFDKFVNDFCDIFGKPKSSVMCKCQMKKLGALFLSIPECKKYHIPKPVW